MSSWPWFSAKVIAGVADDVPGTERRVRSKAQRDGWRSRNREVGKGDEYHVDSLPPKACAALYHLYAPAPAPMAEPSEERMIQPGRFEYDPEELARWAESRSAKQQARGEHCARVLQAAMALHEREGMRLRRAFELVAEQFGEQAGTVKNWYYGRDGKPGARDYRRCDWMYFLTPGYVGRTATADFDEAAWDYFLGDWLRLSQPSMAASYRRLQVQAREHGWRIPAYKTVANRIEREVPVHTIKYHREGPDAVDRMVESGPRDRSCFRALEACNADGHQLDVLCQWPNGRLDRPYVTVVQDLYSNRIIGWHLSATESADSYRLALARALRWGKPRELYLDNTRAAAAKMLTGGAAHRYRWRDKDDDPKGLFTLLDIDVHYVQPYHGQSKPIERAFGDLIEQIAKHPRCEGAYVGSSTENKPANHGTHHVPIDEMMAIIDAGIREYNEREGRRTRVAAGRSFDQVFRESYQRHASVIERPTEAQMRRLLLANQRVTASKKNGAVVVHGNTYWSETLARFAGKPKERRQLVACFDPDDLATGIHLYTLDGREIGHAEIRQMQFRDTEKSRTHNREKQRYKQAARDQASARRRMSQAEVARLNDPEAGDDGAADVDAPTDVNVLRGLFQPLEAASGDDVDAADEADDFEETFSAVVRQLHRQED